MHLSRYPSIALFVLPFTGLAQDCESGRYRTPQFADVQTTIAVPFGSNYGTSGGTQILFMDVYEPVGDVLEQRPVVLVAFGGSFVSGTRADVAEACIQFAQRGYVAIAPDYRVGFFVPNATTTTLAVLRGAHDMKACVRYLRKSVVESANPYRIDPERIIIGGFSAGAISALHAGFLDDDAEWPPVLAPQFASLGGVEGTSGSPGYSSDVLSVYSFSGCLGDTSWIQPEDLPLCSVHEVGDAVVPYYTQEVSVFGFPTGLIASGSHDVHLRLAHMGVDNCLLTYPGSGHVGYVSSDPEGSIGFVLDFCADLVCNGSSACGNIYASVDVPTEERTLSVFPNPTTGILNVGSWGDGPILVLDLLGREVLRVPKTAGNSTIDLSDLPDGTYFLRTAVPDHNPIRLLKTQ